MKARNTLLSLIISLFLLPSLSQAAGANIIMETSKGTIEIELFDDKAPITCQNFRQYVNDSYFDGLIFHRVIPGFMIQGGGFEPGMKKRPGRPPIINEANNGLKNRRGTLSMARTKNVNSATSQFFINVNNNRNLDHRSMLIDEYGYAVFGRVVTGMEVADAIVAVPRHDINIHVQNVPNKDVLIIKMYEKEELPSPTNVIGN